jgi:acylpyruvate hydrolase
VRLATVRNSTGTRAVRVEGEELVDLGVDDVGALLRSPDWERAASADGPRSGAADVEFSSLITLPGKIVCVGLNYRTHILEMGRDLPEHPTLFAKYPEALIGAQDDIALPPESQAVDWEAELGLVIGRSVRRADEQSAAAAIAGFTVVNDVTMRDWQYRTMQWLQGKTFEATTPVGPVLVTPDELEGGVRPALPISCEVDGEPVQEANTDDLVFDPVALVSYVSSILTLQPGDIIATGTPGGVGHARKPPRYLADGSRLVTEIAGIGRLVNVVRAEVAS